SQGDDPQGTLTSPQFTIIGKNISFLIGGACNESFSRAELIVNSLVVRKASSRFCTEGMTRTFWDVAAFIGQRARVKLVDFSSDDWGHINFDDLRGDMSCE
ncbi:uncharacterized protein LOC110066931, partial [Orbicella faveolata]|uniref:uncharacterized protein LOC110066931 n=1 Tax=Orbicella faveolata TaxID=48498 RepID=UPI0009E3F258